MRAISCFLLVLLPLVSSCGFHFAGQHFVSASISPLYLQTSQVDRNMDKSLQKMLKASQVSLTEERSSAAAILHVFGERVDRKVLTVNVDARVREYELRYLVLFDLKKPDGTALINPQRIELFRDYTYDEFSLLGKENEEETLRRELAEDAVAQILRRIQTSQL